MLKSLFPRRAELYHKLREIANADGKKTGESYVRAFLPPQGSEWANAIALLKKSILPHYLLFVF
jgi:hypothetical protein